MVEPFKSISDKYVLNPISGDKDVMFYESVTPAVSFRHYLIYASDIEKLFCVSQKNIFFEKPIYKIAEVLRKESKNILDSENCINLVNGDELGISPFDRLCVLHSSAHAQFKRDIPDVHPITYVVFPCHHSEFSEHDPVDLIRYVRTKVVSSLDWERIVSPRVMLWFEIFDTGQKMHTKKLEISSFEYLDDLMGSQIDGMSALLKVENYKDERIEIKLDGGRVFALGGVYEDYDVFRKHLWEWLTK